MSDPVETADPVGLRPVMDPNILRYAALAYVVVLPIGQLTNVLVVLAVLVIVVSSYALVEGNFGTAYRHRAQIMPLFFVFTGAGLSWTMDRVLAPTKWSRTKTTRVLLRTQPR